MPGKAFNIVHHDRGWDGYFKLDVYHLQHDKFDGSKSNVLRREVLERGHAVAVLPYDPVRDQVILIEQFRPGAISVHHHDPEMPVWLVEIVAGIIEDGETPEDVARRETLEEAGCTITGSLELISHHYVTPGCSSETVTMYTARSMPLSPAAFMALTRKTKISVSFPYPPRNALPCCRKDNSAMQPRPLQSSG